MACSPLPIGADASLSATLASVDCQVNGAVAAGYGRLFGTDGAFGAALSAVLTVYVAFLAYGLITGRTRLTLSAMTPKVLALGLVLTFATAWPAYQTVVYGLLTRGPDEIASAFMGARSGAAQAFTARLDLLFDSLLDLARLVAAQGDGKSAEARMALQLIWVSAITLLLSTLGLLLVARIVLAVLLALGPVFVVMALFSGTRGLFEGWLRTAVAFAFAPMLIVLGGSGVMAVLSPMIAAIADDPVRAVTELRPVVTLFLGAVVYAGLIATLAWTAFSLTRGWRPRGAAGDAPAVASQAHEAVTTAAGFPTTASAATAPVGAERVASVVSAVLREIERAPEVRLEAARAISLETGDSRAGANGPRRAEGLGQTFRPLPKHRPLTGSLGS